MKGHLCSLLACLLPTRSVRWLLNLLGWRLARGARIGFSWIRAQTVHLGSGARIGHLNWIGVRRLVLRDAALIGRGNLLNGPYSLQLGPHAALGNRNRALRSAMGVATGPARLWLGEWAKITSDHRLDLSRSVHLGAFSILAGAQTQVWTHGYVHEMTGLGRYRIDGDVVIGHNVYIGSACLISMGVRIAPGVIVGGGTAVAKDLPTPGLYVSGPVRALPRPADPATRDDLVRDDDPRLIETVYRKRRA